MSDAPASPRPRRTWIGRLGRLCAVALLLVLVLRAVIALFLPSILERVASAYGIRLEVGDVDISFLGGTIAIWHASLVPLDQARDRDVAIPIEERWLDLEYAYLDVDVSALLGGDVRVHRVEIDGLDAIVSRDADGTFNWATLFAPSDDPEPDEEAGAPEESGPLVFDAPLDLSAARLQHVRVTFADDAVDPPVRTQVDLQARLSDLGSKEREARLDVSLTAEDVIESFRVTAEVRGEGERVDAKAGLRAAGLHPRAIKPYLEWIGIAIDADELAARLDLTFTRTPAADGAHRLAATIEDVLVQADLGRDVGIAALRLDVDSLGANHARGVRAELRGVAARVQRLENGRFRALGVEFGGATDAPNDRSEEDQEAGASQAGHEPADATPFVVEVESLSLDEVELVLDDAGILPSTTTRLEIQTGRADGVIIDATRPDAEMTVALSARVPGSVGSIELSGRAAPFSTAPRVDLSLATTGTTLEGVAPYLRAAGLIPVLTDGSLTARVSAGVASQDDGTTRIDLALEDVALIDADELFAIDRAAVSPLVVASDPVSVHASSIEIDGLRITARRDADGVPRVFGLRIEPSSEPPPSEPSGEGESADVTTSPADSPPRVRLDRVRVDGGAVSFVDEAADPRVAFSVHDIRLGLTDLALGGAEEEGDPATADLDVSMRSSGVFDALTLQGHLTSRPGPLDVVATLFLDVTGVSSEPLQPTLDSLDLGVRIEDGRLRLRLEGSARQLDDVFESSFALREFGFENRGEDEVSLAALEVKELRIAPTRTAVESIVVDAPRALVERREDGAIWVAGVRLPAGAKASSTDPGSTATTPELRLGSLLVRGAVLHWIDRVIDPPIDTHVRVDAQVDDVDLPSGPRDSRCSVQVSVDGFLEKVALDGSARLNPDDAMIDLDVAVEGLDGDALRVYAGDRIAFDRARLAARLRAALAPVAAGGHEIEIRLGDVDYRGDRQPDPYLKLDELVVRATRVDPENAVFALDEARSSGLEIDARRTEDGTIEAFGLRLGGQAPDGPIAPAASEPEPAEDESDESPFFVLRRLAAERVPNVTWNRIDVGIDRLRFVDLQSRDPTPVELRLRLQSAEPVTLLDSDPSALTPLRLNLSGAVDPFVSEIEAELVATLFADDVDVAFDLDLSGIDGRALQRTSPALARRVDASKLTTAQLGMSVDARFDVTRASPYRIDRISRLSGVVTVDRLALRAAPEGEALAGVESIFIDVDDARPGTGVVRIGSVVFTNPFGYAHRGERGLEIAGVTLLDSAEPEAPGPNEVAEQPAENETAAPAPSGGEVRVDEILVQGIDFEYRDDTYATPVVLPLTDLDLQVRRLSSRAFDEDLPFSFHAVIQSGDIELPVRSERSNFFVDFAMGAANVASSLLQQGRETMLEKRSAFGEIEAAGRLSLHPRPNGWIRIEVLGLELQNLKGPAAESGVTIYDGVFDTNVSVEVGGEKGTTVNSNSVLSYLGIHESADGPITRWLHLTAPIDVVLFVLRDQHGDVRLPVKLDLGAGRASMAGIAKTTSTVLGSLITDAIASSPFRAVGTVTDLAALLPDLSKPPSDVPPIDVEYPPAGTTLGVHERARIAELGERLRSDASLWVTVTHELGRADLARIDELANPPPKRVLELAAYLRARKAESMRERELVATEARVHVSTGARLEATTSRRRLVEIDRQIAEIETALDDVLSLLDPSAEQRRGRRTRAAADEVALLRLTRIQDLMTENDATLTERVRVRRPRFSRDPETKLGRVHVTIHRSTR